jgi:uncharacterized protein (DUF433 family)
MTSVSVEHIAKTPGVCGGKACIAGHRIRVMDIVVQYENVGLSPAQIVKDVFPSITVADVHAAIAYHLDHREEIEADFRNEEAIAEKYRDMFPSKVKGKTGG